MELSIIFSAFLLVFFAELGDKTQLAAFSLSGNGSMWPVFAGSALALTLSTLIAVCIGGGLGSIGPQLMQPIAGGLLIGFGIYTLWPKRDQPVRDFFLALLQLENVERKQVKRLQKEYPGSATRLQQVADDEQTHFKLFKFVLRKKLLQQDDIGSWQPLQKMSETLQEGSGKIPHNPVAVLHRLSMLEQMTVAACKLVLDHLEKESHHNPDGTGQDRELSDILRQIAEEEQSHAALYAGLAAGFEKQEDI